jgi:N-acetyl-alpha-D-glucosaminyl L-malate synthase BshA
MVCYASVGGSGIVATELAKCLAARGHNMHVISSETPFRLSEYQERLSFHRVMTPAYPLFREPQYLLSLANRIVQLTREFELDIIHAHYAIPHATAGYLAKQILAAGNGPVPQVITTLHGTDITLLGSDPSYSETVAFSIDRSDGVTAVSESLKADTYRALPVKSAIEVIPNFLDCRVHRRLSVDWLRDRFTRGGRYKKIVIHVSNFRPVKRLDAVVEIFAKVRREVPAKLLLVGDGPELGTAIRRSRELGVADDVEALGEQDQVVQLLSISDVFLLPSAEESFGLAGLEAMACEVPVVASNVGGIPEVIEDGINGCLHLPEDVDGMARSTLALLTDPTLHARMAAAARRRVLERFCHELIVPRYESCYEDVLAAPSAGN